MLFGRTIVSSDFDTIFWCYSTFILVSSSFLLVFSLTWAIIDRYEGLIDLQETLYYTKQPNWMLFAAGIGLISAFSGYYFILTKAKIFYLTNAVLMVMSITADLKNYKALLAFEDDLPWDVTLNFKKDVRMYFREGNMDALMINQVQEEFQCCGWRGPYDYNEDSVPFSCCRNRSGKTCKREDIYRMSCSDRIIEYFTALFSFSIILYQIRIIIDIGCLFITTLVYHLLFKRQPHVSKK